MCTWICWSMQLIILFFFLIIISCNPTPYQKNTTDNLNEDKAKSKISISNSSGLIINN